LPAAAPGPTFSGVLRAALALLLAVPAAGATAAPPRAEVGVASSLEKLRPADPTPGARQVALALARGECEAAQVAVRAPRGLAALSAAATPLAGPPGSRPLEATLSRVATLKLDRPSGPDGAPGEWPDPLVPVRDPWFREARRAFPVRVAPGRLQAVWVEVCAPAEASPGRYAGAVTVSERGAPLAEVPVAIDVWRFTLPATGRFVAAFGLSTRLGTRALGVPDDPEVARALAAAAVRHRVTPFTLSADPPDGRCTANACELDWSRYDAEVAPVLDGTLVPGVKGGFAEVRISGPVWSGPETDLLATLRAWKRHFEKRGWADRLWLYTLDEPGPAQYPELQRRARLARKAGIRVFVTTAPTPALADVVDAWAPNLTRVEDGARPPARLSFSYASCMSHGCGELPASGPQRAAFQREFAGWPGYEIDRPGTAARAVAWLAARRGLAGELYYDMLQAWRGDPWTDVRAFAGNGDGTLLYPGRSEALGGRHPFPVESQRLAIIRDALEDLELLALARAAGLSALCDEALATLVPSGRAWERRPEPWLDARRRIADALARRTAER
jgi:hypothetical protein